MECLILQTRKLRSLEMDLLWVLIWGLETGFLWHRSALTSSWVPVLFVSCLICRKALLFFYCIFAGYKFFFLREREREREHTHESVWGAEVGGRETERERERISSRLQAVSTEPDAGLELLNCEIMTWAEIMSLMLTDWATQAPLLGMYVFLTQWVISSKAWIFYPSFPPVFLYCLVLWHVLSPVTSCS